MSKQEEIQGIINNLRVTLPDVKGVLLTSIDGLTIAHALPGGGASRLAAMTAAILGLGESINEAIEAGNLTETIVSGENGKLLVYAVGRTAVLALVVKHDANIALIHHRTRNTVSSISDML